MGSPLILSRIIRRADNRQVCQLHRSLHRRVQLHSQPETGDRSRCPTAMCQAMNRKTIFLFNQQTSRSNRAAFFGEWGELRIGFIFE